MKLGKIWVRNGLVFDGIMEEGLALWRHENAIRDAAREEASAYKQSCYEEGVKYGRQLLAQLNRGEITLEELEKRIDRFEYLKDGYRG